MDDRVASLLGVVGCVTYDLLRLSHMMNCKSFFYPQQCGVHPLVIFMGDLITMWRPWLYVSALLPRRLYAMARRSGLIIAVNDIGAVGDIGVFPNNENLRRAMKTTETCMIGTSELLEVVRVAITISRSNSELWYNQTFVLRPRLGFNDTPQQPRIMEERYTIPEY